MGKKAGIQLKLEGFDELLKEIEAAGRSMNSAVESTMRQSAQIMDSALRSKLAEATESGLAERMPKPTITVEANEITAHVGFEMDTYNPANLSDAYKALFLNYGTPHRSKHGHERGRFFIGKAKTQASPKIKKQQKETLEKILSRLKK